MSTGKGRKERWTGDAHEALAAALARIHGSIKPDEQEALVRDMRASGFDTTWEGIRQHLQKLKRKDGGEASAPSTPVKAKAAKAATPKAKKTPGGSGRKRKNQAIHDAEQDDDEEVAVKKPKLEEQAANFDQYLKDEPVLEEFEA